MFDETPPSRASDSPAKMLARVTPAIVSVFPARILEEEGLSSEEARERFFNRESESKEGEEREAGVGSGVLISADGYVLTNAHVVELGNGALADAVNVELTDRRRFSAQMVGSDSASDIALLKIEGEGFPFLPFADSDHLLVGDPVWAVGNPFKIGLTATAGMVSALNRTGLSITGPGGYEAFIQTDAPINPGNSGGALVDHEGRLVGINTAIWGGLRANVGIGFAVPANFVRHIAGRLREDGEVMRGFLGLRVTEVEQEFAEEAGLPAIRGAQVEEVLTGGPSGQAGLKEGDVILAVAGVDVSDSGYFRLLASLPKPGEELLLTGVSKGKDREWKVQLGDSADFATQATDDFEVPMLPGVRLKAVEEGLEVVSLSDEAGKGIRSRLKEGMVLVEANGEEIKSLEDGDALRAGVNRLKVLQEGEEVTLSLKL
ncbi:MAG: trypsin-like peptidase domain-containing protein [Roseibacillus sp.]